MRPRILIIDDEPTFADALKRTLVAKGMMVKIANSP